MQDSNNAETTLMRVLYDEHAAALWRYALRLTGDRARAEDVVQEVLGELLAMVAVGRDGSHVQLGT